MTGAIDAYFIGYYIARFEALLVNVGTGLKRSHFHRFEGKHWVPVFEVRRHECVGSMKKEPAVLQSQV